MAKNQASLLLQKQLKDLCKKPVDGFSAGLVDENNVFIWSVSIMGPPDTLYEGGFFNAIMTFPDDYPLSPPTVTFTSEMWHPNVYSDGKILEEEGSESESVGYRDLIAIHAANCKDPLKDCLSDDPEKPRRISMDEQLLEGHGKQLWIMQGMFRANGGCGYVKKPRILLEHAPFDPCQRLPIKTTLKVKIYTGQGWDLDFHQTHFDQYSPPDFFVKIGIAGVPRDTVSYRTETAVDQWFPIWSNDEFLFQLSVPELALLWFKVQDYDNDTQNDFAGQTCLPLSELKSGVRAVRLHDRAGKAYKNTRLLVSFALDPPYTFR